MTSLATALQDRTHQRSLVDIWDGLHRPQKELSPKFFYDRRGSELFEVITRLPEYYPSRTERGILSRWMPDLIPSLGCRTIIELGAGSGEKTRLILDAAARLPGEKAYVPIDVSGSFLRQAAQRLSADYPGFFVKPLVSDLTDRLRLPEPLPRPWLVVFLGGTIGNFAPPAAATLLTGVRSHLDAGDRLLLGVDLRKDPAIIEAAYNDAQGVTAAFNINMLRALNHQYRTTFDVSAFRHWAFYHPDLHRIEMHLVATRATSVHVPDYGEVTIAKDESIRTEISCKYDRSSVEALFGRSGLRLAAMEQDPRALFALALGAPANA